MTNTQAPQTPHPMQVPIRYTVRDTPLRIGGLLPPYTILNLATTGTVWFADNPGLKAGLATPLFAGSTLTWNLPGDFYAICDVGDTCDILLVRDITDWTGAVATGASAESIAAAIAASTLPVLIGNEVALSEQRNEETELYNGVLTTSGTVLNVQPYGSLHVEVEFDLPNRCLIMEFREPSSAIPTKRMMIQSGFRTAVTGGSIWRATIPTRGSILFLDTNATGAILRVTGSTRWTDRITQDVMDANQVLLFSNNANYLWQETGNTIPVANNHQIDLYPWIGTITCDVQLTSTAAMGISYLAWFRNQNGVATIIRRDTISPDATTNSYGVTSSIALNGDAPRILIGNGTAVNFTGVNVTVSPTGGAGL